MAFVVHRLVLANSSNDTGISVVEFFSEKLKGNDVVLVPLSFQFSDDPTRKLGGHNFPICGWIL